MRGTCNKGSGDTGRCRLSILVCGGDLGVIHVGMDIVTEQDNTLIDAHTFTRSTIM
jgi:hypothetical protein